MSNKIVRNSLLKSSLSIKGIQSSVTRFNEGITKSRVLAGKIAEQTSNSNRFKQTIEKIQPLTFYVFLTPIYHSYSKRICFSFRVKILLL